MKPNETQMTWLRCQLPKHVGDQQLKPKIISFIPRAYCIARLDAEQLVFAVCREDRAAVHKRNPRDYCASIVVDITYTDPGLATFYNVGDWVTLVLAWLTAKSNPIWICTKLIPL